MSNRLTNIFACLFLALAFVAAVFSMKGDSTTMDEVAHLPAGYSYLTMKDMRLNPEHPPLIKDLAAVPLLFIKGIKFDTSIPDWQKDVNGQWGAGFYFLYKSGNPVDLMMFWGRIPMVLVLVLLGFYIFKISRELFGNKAGILALFMFSFSPTLLAHGRLVTTDIGAAAGFLIATYYFVKSLQDPSARNIIVAGIALGFAELAKFSTIILIPIFAFFALVWLLVRKENFWKVFKNYVVMLIVCFLLVGVLYQYHVINYPAERQVRDTQQLLSSHPIHFLGPVISYFGDKPILRAYAQYALGLALVFQRASFGQTTYFMGEVSAAGWKDYFPIIYAIKETITFHLLTLLSLCLSVYLFSKKMSGKKLFAGLSELLEDHFFIFAFLTLIGAYWTSSLISSLNIGVRHLIPTIPLVMVLVSGALTYWLKPPYLRIKYALLAILAVWQIVSLSLAYPHVLAYFNEIVGGPANGYKYVTDSNLDWGQDLRRLTQWVKNNDVEKIYVDYFGGGDASYYLKEKYEPWWGTRNPEELPKGSYLAISATFLQGGRGEPAKGFTEPSGFYRWLDKYQPVTKIGYSIFVYKIQ